MTHIPLTISRVRFVPKKLFTCVWIEYTSVSFRILSNGFNLTSRVRRTTSSVWLRSIGWLFTGTRDRTGEGRKKGARPRHVLSSENRAFPAVDVVAEDRRTDSFADAEHVDEPACDSECRDGLEPDPLVVNRDRRVTDYGQVTEKRSKENKGSECVSSATTDPKPFQHRFSAMTRLCRVSSF